MQSSFCNRKSWRRRKDKSSNSKTHTHTHTCAAQAFQQALMKVPQTGTHPSNRPSFHPCHRGRLLIWAKFSTNPSHSLAFSV